MDSEPSRSQYHVRLNAKHLTEILTNTKTWVDNNNYVQELQWTQRLEYYLDSRTDIHTEFAFTNCREPHRVTKLYTNSTNKIELRTKDGGWTCHWECLQLAHISWMSCYRFKICKHNTNIRDVHNCHWCYYCDINKTTIKESRDLECCSSYKKPMYLKFSDEGLTSKSIRVILQKYPPGGIFLLKMGEYEVKKYIYKSYNLRYEL